LARKKKKKMRVGETLKRKSPGLGERERGGSWSSKKRGLPGGETSGVFLDGVRQRTEGTRGGWKEKRESLCLEGKRKKHDRLSARGKGRKKKPGRLEVGYIKWVS